MSKGGWIAVDLDGTLAGYDKWRGPGHIGEPVPAMVERVKKWLAEGKEVRIFTARVYVPPQFTPGYWERVCEAQEAREAIRAYCLQHIGQELPITNVKDYAMVEQYDDRAKQVIPNTGILVEDLALMGLAGIEPR